MTVEGWVVVGIILAVIFACLSPDIYYAWKYRNDPVDPNEFYDDEDTYW